VKALSAFRPRVALRVSGAPDPLIDRVVLDACIEFCDRTLIVKRTLDAVSTVADQKVYDLEGDTQQSVVQVMRAWVGTRELLPLSEDDAPPPSDTSTGQPRYFSEDEPGTMTLYPTPDSASYSLVVRSAMRPTRDATQVADVLYEDWVEAITDGALMRIYGMPGDLLNPALASVHAASFMEAVNRARLQALQGRNRAELRVTPIRI
jgi:hypothetical protein